MNLENLKSEWSAMNDRMGKREILEEKMFRQMLNAKSDKSLNRLMLYDIINLIASVLFIPVLFYTKEVMEFIRPIANGAIVILIICVIWYSFRVWGLSKINFTKTLKNNSLHLNRYAIYVKYEKLFGYYFLIPLVIVVCSVSYVKLHAPVISWIAMSCVFIAMIIFTIYFYRLYSKNISTIQQNLEELRELEEK